VFSGKAVDKKGGNKLLTDAAILLFPVDPAQRQLLADRW